MTQRTLPPPAYGITEPIPDGFPDGPILPYAFGSIMVGFQVFSDDHRVAQWLFRSQKWVTTYTIREQR